MSKPPAIEKQILIEATPAEVWDALSKAEGLKNWFPLDAQVTPGVGGSLMLSWGEGSEWIAPIEIWEPSRHLRTVDTMPGKDGGPPLRIAVDYVIESHGGSTLVRLIHSGFASDTWQDEIDSLDAGWTTFLFNLKVYLERHRGESRTMAFYRHAPVEIDRADVFRRTLAALGFSDIETLRSGSKFDATTREGDRFEGELAVFAPPINLTALVRNWSDGVMMIEIEPGRSRCRPAVWISLYGSAQKKAEGLGLRIRKIIDEEFGLAP